MVFNLAKILGGEQLLQANNLRPHGGGLANAPHSFLHILIQVGRTSHLDKANLHAFGMGRHMARKARLPANKRTTPENVNRNLQPKASSAQSALISSCDYSTGLVTVACQTMLRLCRNRHAFHNDTLERLAHLAPSIRRNRSFSDFHQHVLTLDQASKGGVLAIQK